ncbi:MAG TPA: DLW-39 family protein [Rugosimonospora sp.]|nr:DLW-39 family protein [Rugosimonospora sp.]
MWKKLLLLVGILGVGAFVAKKVKDANDERALWHEATNSTDLR